MGDFVNEPIFQIAYHKRSGCSIQYGLQYFKCLYSLIKVFTKITDFPCPGPCAMPQLSFMLWIDVKIQAWRRQLSRATAPLTITDTRVSIMAKAILADRLRACLLGNIKNRWQQRSVTSSSFFERLAPPFASPSTNSLRGNPDSDYQDNGLLHGMRGRSARVVCLVLTPFFHSIISNKTTRT